MMKKALSITAIFFWVVTATAQNTGIGTTTPDANASLELGATDKGLLLNRVALTGTADVAPLSAHVTGMTVYNTATVGDVTPGYYYNNGTQWIRIGNADEEPFRKVSDGSAATNTSTDIYYQGGNVGIGTNNPVNRLTISGVDDNQPQALITSPSSAVTGNYGIAYRALGVGAAWAGYLGNNPNIPLPGAAVMGGAGKNIYLMTGNSAGGTPGNAIDPSDPANIPRVTVLDGSGNVGIGTTSPQGLLDIRGTTKNLAGTGTQTGAVWAGTSNYNGFEASANLTTGDAWVGIQRGGTGAPLHITKPAGTAAGSNLLIFGIGGSYVGSITYNGSGVTYNTTSDFRLKENIHASQYGLSILKQMQVYDYNFKTDKGKTISTGLMAQELYKLYPQAVNVGGEDAKTDPWMVDYSKLTPVLIKAVQELSSKMETLEQALQEKDRQIAELQATVKSVAQLTEEVKK